LGLLLAAALCFHTAHAQQTNPPNNDQAAVAALRDKAFKLLDSLSEQLSSLQSAENRARIGSNIAESIWSHDEKRARDLFKLVADDIKLGLQQSKDDRDPQHTFAVFRKLRQDNVDRIAKHDPELALNFLKETYPSLLEAARRDDGEVPVEVTRGEHDTELRLATKIGPRNAEIAVQLARQSLERGLSDDLLMLHIRLGPKNQEQTTLLYKDIVQKVRDNDFTEYYPVVSFATQLVEQFTPPAADESTYRELVNVLLAKAIAKGCAGRTTEADEQHDSFCVYIGPLLPLMEKYNPGQARRMKQWIPQDYRSDNVTPAYAELNYLFVHGTIDEILALRSKYPALSTEILLRAISRAETDGDIERAQKLAGTYSGDPDVQRALNERFEVYNMSEQKLDEAWAEAQKELLKLPVAERAEQLLRAADFIGPVHRKFALKLLDQANGMVDVLGSGERQTRFQITLAQTYCVAGDDRGFAVMESLLPKLNDLVAAAAKLDGYDTNYLRDGEWNMSGAGSTGNLLTILSNNAASFAWCDFDRAVSLAAQFERAEIRMMAQLKLAQGILDGRPKPFQTRARY
jgi:hypothetical protein